MPNSRRRRARVDLRVFPRLRGIFRLGLNSIGARRVGNSEILQADDKILPASRRKVWIAQMRAVDDYVPGVFSGRVTVFNGERVPFIYPEGGETGWDRYAKGGIKLHIIPGKIHGKQLREPHVRLLAEKMRDSMAKAERITQAPD